MSETSKSYKTLEELNKLNVSGVTEENGVDSSNRYIKVFPGKVDYITVDGICNGQSKQSSNSVTNINTAAITVANIGSGYVSSVFRIGETVAINGPGGFITLGIPSSGKVGDGKSYMYMDGSGIWGYAGGNELPWFIACYSEAPMLFGTETVAGGDFRIGSASTYLYWKQSANTLYLSGTLDIAGDVVSKNWNPNWLTSPPMTGYKLEYNTGNGYFAGAIINGPRITSASSGARISMDWISNNDIILYDASTYSGGVIGGDTSTIRFLRTSDDTKGVILNKRIGYPQGDSDVLEIYCNEPKATGFNVLTFGRGADNADASKKTTGSITLAVNTETSKILPVTGTPEQITHASRMNGLNGAVNIEISNDKGTSSALAVFRSMASLSGVSAYPGYASFLMMPNKDSYCGFAKMVGDTFLSSFTLCSDDKDATTRVLTTVDIAPDSLGTSLLPCKIGTSLRRFEDVYTKRVNASESLTLNNVTITAWPSGGASTLSSLSIDSNKDWGGHIITNIYQIACTNTIGASIFTASNSINLGGVNRTTWPDAISKISIDTHKNWGGYKITNLGAPTNASDAATAEYVTTAVSAVTSWVTSQNYATESYVQNYVAVQRNLIEAWVTANFVAK